MAKLFNMRLLQSLAQSLTLGARTRAITIHKAQGLTLSKVVIDIGRQGIEHQAYIRRYAHMFII